MLALRHANFGFSSTLHSGSKSIISDGFGMGPYGGNSKSVEFFPEHFKKHTQKTSQENLKLHRVLYTKLLFSSFVKIMIFEGLYLKNHVFEWPQWDFLQ